MYIYNKNKAEFDKIIIEFKIKAPYSKIKTGLCPICWRKPLPPNIWVKYHISYKPEMCILACKNCNWIEKLLRTNQFIPKNQIERARLIRLYHSRFGIIL